MMFVPQLLQAPPFSPAPYVCSPIADKTDRQTRWVKGEWGPGSPESRPFFPSPKTLSGIIAPRGDGGVLGGLGTICRPPSQAQLPLTFAHLCPLRCPTLYLLGTHRDSAAHCFVSLREQHHGLDFRAKNTPLVTSSVSSALSV